MLWLKLVPKNNRFIISTWQKRAKIFPILALFLIALAFFYDVLRGDNLFIERDLSAFSIPPKWFWVESMRKGDFPLWNPFNLCGQPFFATLQHAILYPLNFVFFVLPFGKAFNLSIILHVFLGGAFVYALLRDMEANAWASFIGGLSFMLGGYLLSVHSLLPTLVSVIWTPLIVLFFRRALRNNDIKNAIISGVLLAVSFMGGGAEAVFSCLIVLCVMTVFSRNLGGQGILRAASSLGIVVIIFLGLSAVQLLPFLELGRHSIRAGGISYEEASTWSIAPWDLTSFLISDPYGYNVNPGKYWINQNWLKTLYTGFLPFILSCYYFLNGKKERTLWFSIVFVSLFLALGKYNPLHYYVFQYLPFFGKLRFPVKFLSLGILILSVTAGLGLHLLQEKKKEDPAESKFLTIVFVSAFVAACVLAVFAIGHNSLVDYLKAKGLDVPRYNSATVNLSNAKRTLFYLALYGVILKAGLETQWKKWTLFVLSIALAGDLFGNMGYYQSMKTKEYFEPSWVVKQLARDKDLFRVLVTPKTSTLTTIVAADVQPLTVANQLLTPSLNLIYKIYDVRGAEVMRLEKMEEVYNAFVFSPAVDATNLANLFNIKYVITTTPIQSRDYQLVAAHTEGLKGSLGKLMKQPTVKIYKNHEWAPRAFLVDDYKIMKNSDMLPVMMKKDFRPDRVVLLEEKPIWAGREPQGTRGGGKRRADIASISNNRVELTTESPRKSILVLSDAYYPGWKAVVDGEGRKIYRADNAFRAVPLEAGRHVVEFVYDPASFKWGLAISLFTVLAISAMGAVYYYRKRRTV